MSGRTTGVLGAVALGLTAVVAAEAWYVWGASDPTVSAARPVVTGDVTAGAAVRPRPPAVGGTIIGMAAFLLGMLFPA